MEKKFSDLFIEASTFKIIELPADNSSLMEVDQLIATTLKKWADNDDIVSLESNDGYKSDGWTLGNQLYMSLPSQTDNLLNFLT